MKKVKKRIIKINIVTTLLVFAGICYFATGGMLEWSHKNPYYRIYQKITGQDKVHDVNGVAGLYDEVDTTLPYEKSEIYIDEGAENSRNLGTQSDPFTDLEKAKEVAQNSSIPVSTKLISQDSGIVVESQGDGQMVRKADYVPGRLIVKFKEQIPNIKTSNQYTLKSLSNPPSIIKALARNYGEESISIEKLTESTGEGAGLSSMYIFSFDPEVVPESNLAEELRNSREVEYAQMDYLMETNYIPNDPLYPEQWSHQVSNMEEAWEIERGFNKNGESKGVTIAIIDTGVDYTHPDLTNQIWHNDGEIPNDNIDNDKNGYIDDYMGYDFVDFGLRSGYVKKYDRRYAFCPPDEDCENEDSDPMDYHGHGTHCAGISAAESNEIGITGVCPGCKIMPVRAGYSDVSYLVDSEGRIKKTFVGGVLTISDIVQSIEYATENGADVISMSFGMADNPVYGLDLPAMKEAIENAHAEGVVLVAAAGNNRSQIYNYPAAYEEVIAVAATNEIGSRAYYSNLNSSNPADQYQPWIDLAAPGGDVTVDSMILSTVPINKSPNEFTPIHDPSGYKSLQGTSMAAPYVAGVAGLIVSKDGALSDNEIKSQIIEFSDIGRFEKLDIFDDVGGPDYEYRDYQGLGQGRVNSWRSLFMIGKGDEGYIAEITSPEPAEPFLLNDMTEIEIEGSASGSTYRVSVAEINEIHRFSTLQGSLIAVYPDYFVKPNHWVQISEGTTVSNGQLAVLKSGSNFMLTDGQKYAIKLEVFDESGNYITEDVTNFVTRGGRIYTPENGSRYFTRSDDVVFITMTVDIATTVRVSGLPYGWTKYTSLDGNKYFGSIPADIFSSGEYEIVAEFKEGEDLLNEDRRTLYLSKGSGIESPAGSGFSKDIIETIPIKGYVDGSNPKLEYAKVEEESTRNWQSVAILSEDGTIGEIDMADVSAGESYEIRLSSEYDGDIVEEYSNFSIREGWPVTTEGTLYSIRDFVQVDFNDDGEVETLLLTHNSCSEYCDKAYIINSQGEIIKRWDLDFETDFSFEYKVLAGDIDGDGNTTEFVTFSDDLIRVFDISEDEPVYEWATGVKKIFKGTYPFLADIDNDGDLEIVFDASLDDTYSAVMVFNHDGSGIGSGSPAYIKFKKSSFVGSNIQSVNPIELNDGRIAMTTGVSDESQSFNLSAWLWDGSQSSKIWENAIPLEPYDEEPTAPTEALSDLGISADLDGDGSNEYTITINQGHHIEAGGKLVVGNMVYILNSDTGEALWKYTDYESKRTLAHEKALIQLDPSSDYFEVVFGESYSELTYIIDYGENTEMKSLTYIDKKSGTILAGDFNGDGVSDIAYQSEYDLKLYDVKNDTVIFPDDDLSCNMWQMNLSIGDHNKNGYPDLINNVNKGVALTDISVYFNPETFHWIQEQYDATRSGIYKGPWNFESTFSNGSGVDNNNTDSDTVKLESLPDTSTVIPPFGISAGWVYKDWLGVISGDTYWIYDFNAGGGGEWIEAGQMPIDDDSHMFSQAQFDKIENIEKVGYPWEDEKITGGWSYGDHFGLVSGNRYWTYSFRDKSWTGAGTFNSSDPENMFSYVSIQQDVCEDRYSDVCRRIYEAGYPHEEEGVTAGWVYENYLGIVSRERFWLYDFDRDHWIDVGLMGLPGDSSLPGDHIFSKSSFDNVGDMGELGYPWDESGITSGWVYADNLGLVSGDRFWRYDFNEESWVEAGRMPLNESSHLFSQEKFESEFECSVSEPTDVCDLYGYPWR